MKISVVIPAWNVEPWVPEAIESVLQQDLPPHEVIVVVDDGSTDATADVAGSYTGVRVLRQGHRGVAAARNAGAAETTGDALLFLDADDALLPGAISALSGTASRIRDWAAVVPNYLGVGAGRRSTARPTRPREQILARPHVGALIRSDHLGGNALVRREAWRRHRFREELQPSDDFDFWLRLLLSDQRLVILGRPLVRWRVGRPGSLTGMTTLMRESRRLVFEELWTREDLSMLERVLVAYQLARSSAGEAAARRTAGERSPRERLGKSASPIVRVTALALAVPGVLPALGRLDALRHRR
jgi:glycosyltransferase involved in cell wall biosynthesis